ncbi:MAG: hypothetical protein FWE63_00165 [Bacteroidales bacterium]|nr:hypothetical protein [Bacteroidales bacterium]
MNWLFKHSFTSFSLVCFLAATNGLSLVEHYCSYQKESYVYWFVQNPDCSDHTCAPVEKESCCSHEETTACCQNFNKFFKLVADYFSTHNDVKTANYPIFHVEHLFNAENLACPNCRSLHCCGFSSDVGISNHLLIKQTTEFLL